MSFDTCLNDKNDKPIHLEQANESETRLSSLCSFIVPKFHGYYYSTLIINAIILLKNKLNIWLSYQQSLFSWNSGGLGITGMEPSNSEIERRQLQQQQPQQSQQPQPTAEVGHHGRHSHTGSGSITLPHIPGELSWGEL